MARSLRTKRSKADVEQEFSIIEQQAESEKSNSSAKFEAAAQMQEAEIKAAVSEITVEVISKKLSDLSSEISKTLVHLSEKMTNEVTLLKTLREASSLEVKELERLHGIDIAATSLHQLITDYSEKKRTFDAEMEEMKKNWEKEKEIKETTEAEYDESLQKARLRDLEEYDYKKSLERKKIQDCFEEGIKQKEKQNLETQEKLEKGWKEREAILKQKEEEFALLKKEVEQFPTRLATECGKAAKESAKDAEGKFSQEITVLKRDLIVEKQIGELKLKQLQELLAAQQNQITLLQGQLEEAKQQVQDIAIKAIEGASGAKALSHINEIAIEQAKNRTQNRT